MAWWWDARMLADSQETGEGGRSFAVQQQCRFSREAGALLNQRRTNWLDGCVCVDYAGTKATDLTVIHPILSLMSQHLTLL